MTLLRRESHSLIKVLANRLHVTSSTGAKHFLRSDLRTQAIGYFGRTGKPLHLIDVRIDFSVQAL